MKIYITKASTILLLMIMMICTLVGSVSSQSSLTRVYLMGDSHTWAGTYGNQLNYLLGSYWDVLNKGIQGNTTTQMAARFTTDIVTPGNADFVVIWGGINDVNATASAATIESNLQAMYTAASNANIKVVAVTITPYNGLSAPKQTVLDTVNTWIMNTATDIDYKIDAYPVVENPSSADTLLPAYDSGDHLHLNSAGYNLIANTINTGVTEFAAASAVQRPVYVKPATAWTPVATANSGTITSYTSGGYYTQVGKTVTLQGWVQITNKGTAGSYLVVDLPIESAGSQINAAYGNENYNTGKSITGFLWSTNKLWLFFYDLGSPINNNNKVIFSVTYEAI